MSKFNSLTSCKNESRQQGSSFSSSYRKLKPISTNLECKEITATDLEKRAVKWQSEGLSTVSGTRGAALQMQVERGRCILQHATQGVRTHKHLPLKLIPASAVVMFAVFVLLLSIGLMKPATNYGCLLHMFTAANE